MKKKNILALLIALCMLVTLFAACSSTEEKPEVSGSPSKSPSVSQNASDEPEDIVDINFWLCTLGTDVTMLEGVEDGINAITEEAIGVHVNMSVLPVTDYGTQLSLAITNKESIDVAGYTPIPGSSWRSLYSNGAMLDMADLLEQHGQDIKELFGEDLLRSTSVGDSLYGLVNYKLLNSNTYFCYRKDILEQCGVYDTLQNAKTWSDFEEVLAAIKNNGGMYAIGGNRSQAVVNVNTAYGVSGNLADTYRWDALSDSLNYIWSDDQGNVKNRYEVDDFVAGLKIAADWYAKGYVFPDSAISAEQTESLIAANNMAGFITNGEYGVETSKSQSCGHEMTCPMLTVGMITGDSATLFGTFIPASASEPEAAMKFLNLLYTDADMMNLLLWGVEGVNYVVNDGIADYPEGLDASSCGWHLLDFQMGNQFLALPWAGSPGGTSFRKDALDNFLSAPVSEYLGLNVDTSDYGTLIAALTQVNNEFSYDLLNGLYTEKLLSEFLDKLDSAGMDEYIELYQNAVNDFMA